MSIKKNGVFSVCIKIKILVIHNKNSFASPLNNDEWIILQDCREIFCILFQRDSFSALQQSCNLLKMLSLLCDSGTCHQCKKLCRGLLRLFFKDNLNLKSLCSSK